MFFTPIVLFASFSVLSGLAAPIPLRRRDAQSAASPRDVSGWPQSTASSEQTAFGNKNIGDGALQEVDGAPALVATYPAGSYAGATIGGFIFDATGPSDVTVDTAEQVSFSYEVNFPTGFDFVKGGKLPGMFGGDSYDIGTTCSGGRHNQGCWSARLMFRAEGAGELYAYLPTQNNNITCSDGPCNFQYGDSIGRGSWTFPTNEWTSIEERVKLSTPGKFDGEIEVLIGGVSKITQKVYLRETDAGKIRGAMIHTFFGGSSSPDFATPKKQEAYFRNFVFKVLN